VRLKVLYEVVNHEVQRQMLGLAIRQGQAALLVSGKHPVPDRAEPGVGVRPEANRLVWLVFCVSVHGLFPRPIGAQCPSRRSSVAAWNYGKTLQGWAKIGLNDWTEFFAEASLRIDQSRSIIMVGKEIIMVVKKNKTMQAVCGMVCVTHGANDGFFPFGGKSVGSVKKALQSGFSIPYFAEGYVKGEAVTLDHVLAAGDHLEFLRAFGYKAAKDERRREEIEADGLLAHYPQLVEIAEEVVSLGLVNATTAKLIFTKIARLWQDHFGPIPNAVLPTLNEVVSKLTRLADRLTPLTHGKQPRKSGRKPTTRKLAEFAQDHPELTWKEIADLWKKKHPNDKDVKDERARGAYRRAYSDKSLPPKKKRAE
jgi:hypothetical protein